MKQIPLTKGRFTIVDDDDYEELSKHKWLYVRYAQRLGKRPDKQWIYMHRFIMNAPKHLQVDHINGDKLDNRKSNLRLCTRAENNRNISITKNNTSGYKGVRRAVSRGVWKGTWRATICFNSKLIHLGSFKNITDAARAYDKKARELFGEFANLNFPETAGDV